MMQRANRIKHSDITDDMLRRKIKSQSILFGGNEKKKIYGRLDCASGKRMKRESRVFFASEEEAVESGFRPCGHCMKDAYIRWISSNK